MRLTPYLNPRLLRPLKWLLALFLLYLICHLLISEPYKPPKPRKRPKPVENYTCPFEINDIPKNPPIFHKNNGTDAKILVILDSLFSRHGKSIIQVLNSQKFAFKAEAVSKNLPVLTTARKGRYSLIIVENYYKYLNMARWNRQLLDKYCKEYKVPVFSFISSKPNDQLKRIRIKGSSLWMWQNQRIQSLTATPSPIHKISKIGASRQFPPANSPSDWVLFESAPNFEPILTGTVKSGYERAVVVDIDDVFVGAQGTRIVEEDVRQLITAQHEFQSKYVENFQFMLGFSGSYFRNGDELEDRGDELLIENAKNFVWFPHMWRHNHAHEHNFTYLEAIMAQNRLFAQNMKIPVDYPYAIAPQHDGVFPVHEQMFEAWKKVWNVSATATEEYPHFKPSTHRKGFIHSGIHVLPRQTCGLYTHTQLFDEYPEGFEKVQKSIQGGDLFFTILMNPISIFMTHQQNYAHDRMALYTFENLFRFLKCWTNLSLKWQDPIKSAQLYFEKFPEEKTPVWTNPCQDPRHQAILPPTLNCTNMTLPNLLILGPQKTGSTALANFLTLHPNVSQNSPIPGSFEEVQFFGGANYLKGIDWYLSNFQNASIIFEKSATYFDNPVAPKQASSLIPNTKLVVILQNPTQRAYSWFQHLLAHKDPSALTAASFSEILEENPPETLRKIRQRCISGGRYVHHLGKWLEHFSLAQIMFIDADELRDEPARVLTALAKWLDLPDFPFETHLRYSPSKGFHCRLIEGKTKCLGESKGRKYPKMSDVEREKLDKIFGLDNSALYKFLRKNRLKIPNWLEESVRIRA
uniref:[heparan sulfate]-glucosamine N-sulfotransferase n=1 Tax=Caenorhabditis japonica TaxID=281687 RepID=A0A8R1DPB1_CAEJA